MSDKDIKRMIDAAFKNNNVKIDCDVVAAKEISKKQAFQLTEDALRKYSIFSDTFINALQNNTQL